MAFGDSESDGKSSSGARPGAAREEGGQSLYPEEGVERRVLIIDDNPAIHGDFKKIFTRQDELAAITDAEMALFGTPQTPLQTFVFQLDYAFQGQEGVAMVEKARSENRPYAMAFVDVRMPPGWDGVETTGHIWEADQDVQVVLCTAFSDYSLAEIRDRLGYGDRFVILKKPFDNIEVLQLAGALTEKWRLSGLARTRTQDLERMVDVRTAEQRATLQQLRASLSELAQSEAALRRSRAQNSEIVACATDCIISVDATGLVTDFNPAAEKTFGYSRADITGQKLGNLFVSDIDPLMKRTPSSRVESTARRADRSEFPVEITVVKLAHATPATYTVFLRDLTEQRRIELLEEQFRQSQKMEALGQLAGGIAHDFNNILSIINGYSAMLLTFDNPSSSSEMDALKEIYVAGERAAKLTNHLLTFSRNKPIGLQPINLVDLVDDSSKLLARLIGENVQLRVNNARNLPVVQGDAGMIEQILLNLTINARDAISKTGRIEIATSVRVVGDDHCRRHRDAKTGEFVCLSVEDNGCGMSPEVMRRIFEPFFTTKEEGKGTGLGLSTVFGIVKQHGGWVEVSSQLDVGTRFDVYLPVATGVNAPAPSIDTHSGVLNGKETVLVVEDDDSVRMMASAVLKKYGYRVLEASSAEEAIEVWERHGDRIALLLTDIVMTGDMTGPELASQLLARKPELKVVYTSGYSAGTAGQIFDVDHGIAFIEKPCHPRTLAYTVRTALNDAAEKRKGL